MVAAPPLPDSLAKAVTTPKGIVACVPLAFSLDLAHGTIDLEVQRACDARCGVLKERVF